jgi:hypothetical protein
MLYAALKAELAAANRAYLDVLTRILGRDEMCMVSLTMRMLSEHI